VSVHSLHDKPPRVAALGGFGVTILFIAKSTPDTLTKTAISDIINRLKQNLMCASVCGGHITKFKNIADERTVAVMTREEKLNKIVEILHEDCKTPLEEIQVAIGAETLAEVGDMIDELIAKRVILGYGAIVDWDKLENYDKVVAYIEIKVTPQRYKGFDRIAERIYRYDEVKELNLISGTYDFGVTVEGRSIKDISLFVSDHLGPMESIIGTATHFVLKRYKKDGIILCEPPKDEREVISI